MLFKNIFIKFTKRYSHLNLRNKFIVPVVVVLFVSFFIFTVYLINDQRSKSLKLLQEKAERTTFLLINSNLENIWNFNKEELTKICDSFFKDDEIALLEIFNDKNDLMYQNKKDYPLLKNDIMKKETLSYKDTQNIGTINVVYTSAVIENNLSQIRNKLIFLSIFLFFVVILLISKVSNIALRPLAALMDGVKHLTEGNLKYKVDVLTFDELGKLAESFNTMSHELNQHQENLEGLVHERTEQLQKAMESLWGEMELAKKIQTVLLPTDPKMHGYDIAASLTPADEVGGDYYDVITVDDLDWIVIGDVSGHGVPAGLIMMMVQTAIHTILSDNPNLPTSQLLTAVNTTIADNIERLGESKYMTMTVFAGVKNGEFIFSGLHQDILIYRAATKKVEAIETSGMWLGLTSDVKGMMPESRLKLEENDVMLLYTDGVTEAMMSSSNEMYGDERLADSLEKTGHLSSEKIHDTIIEELSTYKKPDDVTIMVIKRIPKK